LQNFLEKEVFPALLVGFPFGAVLRKWIFHEYFIKRISKLFFYDIMNMDICRIKAKG